MGPEAPGLSASTIARLKEVWQGELEHWQRRDLSAKRYVYFWADGVYFSPRLDHDKQCMCVIIGADELGRKELLAIADGYRESAQSWREVLLDLKRRGLAIAPELATGDGALGFWKASREVYGTTRGECQKICARAVLSDIDEPFAEDDGELCFGLQPFLRRSFPRLGRMIENEI